MTFVSRFLGLATLAAVAALAGSSRAALFPCDEAGLDAAIAASEAGDPGPHALDCSPGDTIPLESARNFTADLTLDGRGVTIECTPIPRPPRPPPYPPLPPICRATFDMVGTLICPAPTCDPPVFGPPPTIELRGLTLLEIGLRLPRDADLTLRNVVVNGRLDRSGAGRPRSSPSCRQHRGDERHCRGPCSRGICDHREFIAR